MSWIVALCVGLLLIAFLLTLTAFSLRDFSHSRLQSACEEVHRTDRFGEILAARDTTLLGLDFLLLAVLIGLYASLAELLQSALRSADAVAGWFGPLGVWCLVAAGLGLVLVSVPWTLARLAGERWMARIWPALSVLQTGLKPILAVARFVDRLLHRLAGKQDPHPDSSFVLAREIRAIVDQSQRGGSLEADAKTMIHRVIELQNDDVAAIMTPRTDMVTIPLTATLEEARESIVEHGFSRIPVIGSSPDDVRGILYARDLLEHLTRDHSDLQLSAILREPKYVPETMGIANLLETMKREQVQLAIVVDEYSGVAGLVTMEDILEEIVGEIADEYDEHEELMMRSDAQGVVEVDARVHIDELNERFGYELPEHPDYDTIGGFALSEFGRIPSVGESFDSGDLQVTVTAADARRILSVRIQKSRIPSENAAESRVNH